VRLTNDGRLYIFKAALLRVLSFWLVVPYVVNGHQRLYLHGQVFREYDGVMQKNSTF
jgi:hypothetical protein